MKIEDTEQFKLKFEERMRTLFSKDPETVFYAYLNSQQRYFADMLLLNNKED